MHRFSRSITGWFGYSRRERRASVILLAIILCIIICRLITGPARKEIRTVTPAVIERESPLTRTRNGNDSSGLFRFDPNIAGYEELLDLGLSSRQARVLVNYRLRGGRFRTGSDLGKIFGLDSDLICRLRPYVAIKASERHDSAKRTFRFIKHPYDSVRPVLDLNKCDSAELEGLPAIGPVLASRIIKYRNRLGGFVSRKQLLEVRGLRDSTLRLISDRVTADSLEIQKTDINKASFRELIRQPYLDRKDVQSILKYRSIMGKIDSLPELVKNRIISSETAVKIRPYFSF